VAGGADGVGAMRVHLLAGITVVTDKSWARFNRVRRGLTAHSI
jgi:hypothetical protein